MKDDGFYNMFKDSSETDRNFEFRTSSWDKLNNRLNADLNKKRRRILMLLPWFILPGLLGYNLLQYQNQKKLNDKLSILQQEIKIITTTHHDTIVKEIHHYTHDTVYVIVQSNSTMVRPTQHEMEVYQQATYSDKFQSDSLYPTAEIAASNKKKKINYLENGSSDSSSQILKLNSNIDEDYLTMKADSAINSNPVDPIINSSSIKNLEPEKEEIRETLADKLKKVKIEYGVLGGIFSPVKIESYSRLGFHAGVGMNVFLSDRIIVATDLGYRTIYVSTGGKTQDPWLEQEASPDSSYVLNNASTYVSAAAWKLDLRYALPLNQKLNLLFDIGYGIHYLLPYKVVYEFKNSDPSLDLVVERKPDHTGWVTNDFIVGLGLGYMRSEKHSWYLFGNYTVNGKSTLYALPDNFGLSIGVFF